MFGAFNLRWLGLMIAVSLSVTLLGGCSGNAKEEGNGAEAPKPSQEQLQRAELLNRTAEDMYQKMLQGDIEDSRIVLQQLSDQLNQIRFEGMTSVDGMNALVRTVTDAQRILDTTALQPNERQVAAAKIRLATDALTHANQPLWLQYYDRLQDDVNDLEQAARDQNKLDLQSAASRLEHDYGIIQPSLLIGRSAVDVEKMDSLVIFVRSQPLNLGEPFKNVLQAIPPMRQMLDKLFMKRETTAYLPYAAPQNPILWTLTFGIIILSSLAFAGWRLSKKHDGLIPVRRGGDDLP
ncbi:MULTISPECIES: sporulation protein YpjB [unclassified Paenibacillus]|uniref:sporulation protein YpjB n=1 Tax=unclassified Paenibacillus TaxID=185978 RepID=UPI001AE7A6E2|nr:MULTISPECIES: sporulation protein YpjB [unclassified Paenibacillus]MBP1155288.1 sporulation protein YpjB [Paenibacillus sp. PvP091]MBP1169328.1 sporulation protein YpjB [Paenibacillus sp. PvR098]MBP2440356.1 sporulation protein YpjB [Paenibacillus sp. PvP052]